MHRRKFFKLGFLSLGAVAAGGGAYVFFEKFEELAKKIILADTAGLGIDRDVYDQFFIDIEKKRKWDSIFFSHHKQILKWHYYINNPLFTLPYKTSYEVNRSKLVGTFLLSTNFFYEKMNPQVKIKYIGLHDPYERSCANPFSNIYYQS